MEIGIVDVQKKFVQSEFAVCSLYKRVLRINLLKSISQSTSILFAEKTNRKLAFTPHAPAAKREFGKVVKEREI